MLVLRAFAVWLVLIIVEFIHSAVRMLFLVPIVGDFYARQVGVLTGSLLILMVAYLFHGWIRADTGEALALVGLLWLVLTTVFRVGYGHFVFGRSWEMLVSDFNVAHGGLVPVGLVVLALSPWIAKRMRGIKSRGTVPR